MDHSAGSGRDLPEVNRHRVDQVEPKSAESLKQVDEFHQPHEQPGQKAQAEQMAFPTKEEGRVAATEATRPSSSYGPARTPRTRADRVIKGGLCKARRTKPRFLPKSIPLQAALDEEKDKRENQKERKQE